MDPSDRIFGDVAIALGVLSQAQLVACRAEQRRDPAVRMPEICLAKGFLSPQQIDRVLVQQKRVAQRRKKGVRRDKPPPRSAPARRLPRQPSALLGQIAVDEGLIDLEQLARATKHQGRQSHKKLGEIMVETGMIAAVDLDGLLVEQHRRRTESEHRAVPAKAPPRRPPLRLATPALNAKPPPRVVAPKATEKKKEPAEPGPRIGRSTDRPLVEWFHQLLERAIKEGASDLHVHAEAPVKIRRYGKLVAISDQPLSASYVERMLFASLSEAEQEIVTRRGQLDLAYSVEGLGRFRGNVFRQHRGLGGVFHVIPFAPPTLAKLGLPTSVAKLTNYHQGIVLITGPGGSGKTSTLASLIALINEERADHILTIEDPIEYIHPSKRCVINQRQVIRHTGSFARALRAALREDPDVICIGELRDLESISLALSAAETGHLVLATLHTRSAMSTITRVIGAYPPAQQAQVRAMLSESLRAVIAQRLIPRKDGAGMALALELLFVNHAVANLIRDNRTFQLPSVMQTGKRAGMVCLDDSLEELVQRGQIDRARAARYADDPRRFGGV